MKVKDQFVCAISIYVILFHMNIRLNMESDEPKGVVHTSLSLSLFSIFHPSTRQPVKLFTVLQNENQEKSNVTPKSFIKSTRAGRLFLYRFRPPPPLSFIAFSFSVTLQSFPLCYDRTLRVGV